MSNNSQKIARRRGTARLCTGSYLHNLPDNRGNETGVTVCTRGRGRGRGGGRGRGRGGGRINVTERVQLAQPGRVLPTQPFTDTFEEVLARHAREDAERAA